MIPDCVKTLLICAGFDTISSLSNLNEKSIVEIEQYLSTKKGVIAKLNCCYSDEYKNLEKFEFLPGHKAIILAIPDMLFVRKLHRNYSDQDLKNMLINKLTTASVNAARKKGFQFAEGTISEANLIRFHRPKDGKNIVSKCSFSCPFCSKVYALTYKTYWKTNNAWTHLKNVHIENYVATQ